MAEACGLQGAGERGVERDHAAGAEQRGLAGDEQQGILDVVQHVARDGGVERGEGGRLGVVDRAEQEGRPVAEAPATAPGAVTEIAGAKGRPQGKGLVACLPGVDDRDTAAALVGSDIHVAREQLPPPGKDEYYWVDLEGLEVVTTEGAALGRVSHLFATGANDVVVVRDGARERLIPFVQGSYVRSVDLSGGRMVVDWDPEF